MTEALPKWAQIHQAHGGFQGVAQAALKGAISDEDLSYLASPHYLFQMLAEIWKKLQADGDPMKVYRYRIEYYDHRDGFRSRIHILDAYSAADAITQAKVVGIESIQKIEPAPDGQLGDSRKPDDY